MNKLALVLLLLSGVVHADPVTFGEGCSYGAPISAVYPLENGDWIIQVYGGQNVVGGSDLRVNYSQLVFKGIKGTKSLNDFKLGWAVEDKGMGGIGNGYGQCDYTDFSSPVYILKK